MIVITGITKSQLEKLHDPSTGSFAILSPYKSKEEIQAESFEAWWATKQMLERKGLPPGMEVELGVSTGDIAQNIPGYR